LGEIGSLQELEFYNERNLIICYVSTLYFFKPYTVAGLSVDSGYDMKLTDAFAAYVCFLATPIDIQCGRIDWVESHFFADTVRLVYDSSSVVGFVSLSAISNNHNLSLSPKLMTNYVARGIPSLSFLNSNFLNRVRIAPSPRSVMQAKRLERYLNSI
jgi:hypothetical protein